MAELDARTERNLKGVHPDLVKVVRAVVAPNDTGFIITCGTRTVAEQRELVAKGASKTMNSRHIPGPSGYSHAVDFAVTVNGKIRWDWPLYLNLSKAVKAAAAKVGVTIEWGGDWKSFKDGPHFQLPHSKYPN